MKPPVYFCVLLLAFTFTGSHAAEKKGGPPEAITVEVQTGTGDGQLKFVPDKLRFERGKYYKLVIHNPSKMDHYFSSEGMGTHVYTRKVEVANEAGETLAEIHGDVYDMELKPGSTVAWYFYPMTNGKLKLYCHKEDHEQHGMVGEIEIFGPPPFTN
jgi:uncharacterized cupredoxin-like copper-binding protein